MKIRYFTIIVVVVFMLLFPTAGLIGFQSGAASQDISINKVISSDTVQNVLKSNEPLEQENTIFSKTTVITLILAVMGVVAFRRNNYN